MARGSTAERFHNGTPRSAMKRIRRVDRSIWRLCAHARRWSFLCILPRRSPRWDGWTWTNTGRSKVPREIVFVIDTSGSQMGFPLEKSKKLADEALNHLNANDTFNIITFAGNTQILFPEPVAPTPANMQRAHALLGNLTGGGGTEMMKAIRAALDPSDSSDHLRVACLPGRFLCRLGRCIFELCPTVPHPRLDGEGTD